MRAANAFVLMLIAGCASTGPVEPMRHEEPTAAENWLNVGCDIVIETKRAECLAQHRSVAIPDNESTDSYFRRQQQEVDASHGDAGTPSESPESPQPLPRACYASSGYRPIIDTQGVDTGKLECDLSDCQAYAAQINPVQSAVSNAVAGAIVGALFGLAVGDHGWAARAGAQGGAVGGALGGAGGAAAALTNVVRNCMAGRGYRVLQ